MEPRLNALYIQYIRGPQDSRRRMIVGSRCCLELSMRQTSRRETRRRDVSCDEPCW